MLYSTYLLSVLTVCQTHPNLRYLSWKELLSFVDRQVDKCISEGNLEGTLLLGLGMEGMELLQAYLDRTGDVQTVALLGCRQEIGKFGCRSLRGESIATVDSGSEGGAVSTRSVQSITPRFNEWMSCYRSLLNHWQMWHARATLDIALSELAAESRAVDPSYSHSALGLGSEMLGQTKGKDGVGGGVAHHPHLNVRCMFCNQNLPLSSLRHQVCVYVYAFYTHVGVMIVAVVLFHFQTTFFSTR